MTAVKKLVRKTAEWFNIERKYTLANMKNQTDSYFANPLLQKYAWTETHIRNWRQKKRRI